MPRIKAFQPDTPFVEARSGGQQHKDMPNHLVRVENDRVSNTAALKWVAGQAVLVTRYDRVEHGTIEGAYPWGADSSVTVCVVRIGGKLHKVTADRCKIINVRCK